MGEWNKLETESRLSTVFSQTSQNALLEMTLLANLDRKDFDCKRFIARWLLIDWSDRESIRKVLPFIEASYGSLVEDFSSMRRDVDAALGQDGFRFRDGKLRQIVFSSDDATQV